MTFPFTSSLFSNFACRRSADAGEPRWWKLALLAMAAPWGVRANSAPTVVKPIANLTVTPGTPIHLPDLDQTFSDPKDHTLHFEIEGLPEFLNASLTPLHLEASIAHPERAGSHAFMYGDLAFHVGTNFTIFNVSGTPQLLGQLPYISGSGVAGVCGGHAITVADSGLRFINVTDPSQPRSGLSIPSVLAAAVWNRNLFTFTYMPGQQLNTYALDAPNEARLTYTRPVNSAVPPLCGNDCISLSSPGAIATLRSGEWRILDSQTNSDAVPISANRAYSLALQGDLVYTAAASGLLEIYEARIPPASWVASRIGASEEISPSHLDFVTLSGSNAFVMAAEPKIIAMLNISDPRSVQTLAKTTTRARPHHLSVSGQRLAASFGPDGFDIYSLNQLKISGVPSWGDLGSHNITIIADNGESHISYTFWIHVVPSTTSTTRSQLSPLQPAKSSPNSDLLGAALAAIGLLGVTLCSLISYVAFILTRSRARAPLISAAAGGTTSSSGSASSTSTAATPPGVTAAASGVAPLLSTSSIDSESSDSTESKIPLMPAASGRPRAGSASHLPLRAAHGAATTAGVQTQGDLEVTAADVANWLKTGWDG